MTQIKFVTATMGLFVLLACSWIELPPPRSNPRDVIMDVALAQIDRPFRNQGTDPTGFDASGLVRYVFSQAGIELPHSAEGQRALGKSIPFNEIRRGDLLFYAQDESAYPQMHVGIYVGQSRMVHIPEQDRVRIEVINTPYWRRRQLDTASYLP